MQPIGPRVTTIQRFHCNLCYHYLVKIIHLVYPTPPLLPPPPSLGLLCHCNETGAIPRPHCLDNSFTCQAGFACYTERFVSPELDSNGQEVINMRWGCLGMQPDSSFLLLESFCDENLYSDTWMVKCCNSTDKCNADLKLKLPVEGSPPPTFSTAEGQSLQTRINK